MREKDAQFVPVLLRIMVGAAMVLMAFAILAGCFPHGGGLFTSREEARRAHCLSNMKQIGLALKQYSMDFRDEYPWHTGLSKPADAWLDLGMLYPNYNTAWVSFFCPSSKDRPFEPKSASGDKAEHPLEPLKSANTKEVISYSYCYDSTGKTKTAWTENAKSTVRLAADKKAGIEIKGADIEKANHKDEGRNLLYHDGHVKWKEGAKALDPDGEDDEVGKPGAKGYADWWSDPPFYAEGMEEEEEEDASD